MALKRLMMFLVMFAFKGGEGGGHHGGHHRDHLKIYLPEFIHHGHHTKVITIHHHHHKPKHHHHHHHHHHPKSLVLPYSHRMYHRKKTHNVSKGHTLVSGPVTPVNHVPHHAGHGSKTPVRDFSGYMPHQNSYEESTSFKYNPSITLKNTVNPFSPSAPTLTDNIPKTFTAGIPQVHGVQHTVKQIMLYNTVSGSVPNSGASTVATGYKVTEEGEEEDDTDDDVFTVVNPGQGSFQESYGYLHQADFTPDLNNHFTQHPSETTAQSYDSFPTSPQLTSISADGIESYSGSGNVNNYFSSGLSTAELPSASDVPDQPQSFDGSEYSDMVTFSSNFVGEDVTGNGESPISFYPVAGI